MCEIYNKATPVFDSVRDFLLEQEISPAKAMVTAMVFGVVWRYNQMAAGVCYARQDRMAEDIQICVRSFQRHLGRLVNLGLIVDEHPGRRGKTHNYRVSPAGYDLLGEAEPPLIRLSDVKGDFYDSESDKSPNSCCCSGDKSHENESKENEFYALYTSDFGEMTPGQQRIFQKWLDTPAIMPEWIELAVTQTIATQPAKPWAYLWQIMRAFIANGGPAELAPAASEQASEPQKASSSPAPASKLFEGLDDKETMVRKVTEFILIDWRPANVGKVADYARRLARGEYSDALARGEITPEAVARLAMAECGAPAPQ